MVGEAVIFRPARNSQQHPPPSPPYNKTAKKRTVFDSILQHQLRPFLTRLPPGRHTAPGRLATELSQLLVRLIQDGMLLFEVHRDGVFVGIAV